ncbi:cytochrome oxidase assembly protein ShyY1 [Glaciihabitans tibetensis]|uniref:SURF1-like protein n=1 Tax=Glaciihabitans tibetensis TaxID=1266600 RepID=A0A2T0VJS6_9MICO|nr:SURF1 family protein [Glaciihabitans tibetensis]PRY70454.1 cytochrome oxidase assembly protein ShyY1 [Glaciihabitans tibetensis]
MRRWRFAFGRRWFGYLGFAIVFAIACVLLSHWQFARREDALAEIAKVEQNYDADPVALADVLADTEAFEDTQEWTPVEMTGTYLDEDQLLVRSRPYGGRPGFEVLTPLRLDDGRTFIVDRGWVPTGEEQDSPDFVPAPPSGEVTVTARLKPGEPNLRGRSAPEGQVSTINLPTVADLVGGNVYTGAYGLLEAETPAPADARPAAAIRPDNDEGPHLSYAFQWLVFALFGFFGLGYALRTEYRLLNADDPEEQERAAERERRARAKPPSDNDVEDEIVNAALR